MKKSESGSLIFSPSDLIRYLNSSFASWMDRYHLENPSVLAPDKDSADQELIAKTGIAHEEAILAEYEAGPQLLAKIKVEYWEQAARDTLVALDQKIPIVYQAALSKDNFAGYADFLELNDHGEYEVWDTKLARSPKPYFIIQLCCYSEMLATTTNTPLPRQFGVILGTNERVSFRLEDFYHYYLAIKTEFLKLQGSFDANFENRPIPMPSADHGRWSSHAEKYNEEADHLIQVANISKGQIKKLERAGITTMEQLGNSKGVKVPNLHPDSLAKLILQANLQCQTRALRQSNPDSRPVFEVLDSVGPNQELVGLATLPAPDRADVFFDMEGYPLEIGGLEYLFGAWVLDDDAKPFKEWWAHDRGEEKIAFEGFIDWVYDRWKQHPGMHIYHYAAYEVSAVKRLSTRHDTRQDEVDALLRNKIFVDLYMVVRKGLVVGEDSYSIKRIERLYWQERQTEVGSAVDSIVRYALWKGSGEDVASRDSGILKKILEYNKDDCESTANLAKWLRRIATENGIPALPITAQIEPPEISEDTNERKTVLDALRERKDLVSTVLGDLIEFHWRELKVKLWTFYNWSNMTDQELREDADCVEGVERDGVPTQVGGTLHQTYRFDTTQECNVIPTKEIYFVHNAIKPVELFSIDQDLGKLVIKATSAKLENYFDGSFPLVGSLISKEFDRSEDIAKALSAVANGQLSGTLHKPVHALLGRVSAITGESGGFDKVELAKLVAREMNGGCLVIQGPPGTGKTYTASQMILDLVMAGKKVGIASNSHKAIMNLLRACAKEAKSVSFDLQGVKGGGDSSDLLFENHRSIRFVKGSEKAIAAYSEGILAGTAWLFSHDDIVGKLDYLFIDEAGQVSLANAVAMSRSARNLVLLGDQMQLEQPIQGSHPGWSGLSALQYCLLDTENSTVDRPEFHAVVPPSVGLFLKDSRRMHSSVRRFISESIYEGRLGSHPDCDRQSIDWQVRAGIVFVPVEHEGNTQTSIEEVSIVREIYNDLLGRDYTDKNGVTKPLSLEDFLFIAPYNAQVRALEAVLPPGARVGSVDRIQGQEAPVCIVSMCSSFGEYGSRGLAFILDRNRLNVAISRAQCLAIVVGDPRTAAAPTSSIKEMELINLYSKLVRGYSIASD